MSNPIRLDVAGDALMCGGAVHMVPHHGTTATELHERIQIYSAACDLVSMVDVKNDCRRVAANGNEGDGFQGLTPLAIHFRRVAAQNDDGFR